MSDGAVYWIGVSLGTLGLFSVFVVINQVSDGSIFVAGCFVSFLVLLGVCFTIIEFRKM
jgi:hypothetical protein